MSVPVAEKTTSVCTQDTTASHTHHLTDEAKTKVVDELISSSVKDPEGRDGFPSRTDGADGFPCIGSKLTDDPSTVTSTGNRIQNVVIESPPSPIRSSKTQGKDPNWK